MLYNDLIITHYVYKSILSKHYQIIRSREQIRSYYVTSMHFHQLYLMRTACAASSIQFSYYAVEQSLRISRSTNCDRINPVFINLLLYASCICICRVYSREFSFRKEIRNHSRDSGKAQPGNISRSVKLINGARLV